MKKAATTFLIVLIVLENIFLFYSYKVGLLNHEWNAVLFFLSSLLIGIVVLYKFYNVQAEAMPFVLKRNGHTYLLALLSIICLVWCGFHTKNIIHTVSIDISNSDIIPAIQITVKRFLSGEYPYSPLTSLGYTTPVGYMPMHWMPFCTAEIFHFDYRIVTFLIWCLFSTILLARLLFIEKTTLKYWGVVLLTASYYFLAKQNHGVIGITVETMIAGYYMFLIIGLNQKNTIIQGIAIALCLLSRFTLLMWLPLWALALFVSGNRKELFKTSAIVTLLVTIIYIIPFLSKDWGMLFTTISSYSNLAWEWQHLCDNGLPCHLHNGVGFAYFFYHKYLNIGVSEGFQIYKRVFFMFTTCSVAVMAIWYWLYNKKIHYKIFLLASFKIYLSIFLAFIIVPYEYLMITGNFVSIAILAEQARYRIR